MGMARIRLLYAVETAAKEKVLSGGELAAYRQAPCPSLVRGVRGVAGPGGAAGLAQESDRRGLGVRVESVAKLDPVYRRWSAGD